MRRSDYQKLVNILKKLIKMNANKLVTINLECGNNDKDYLLECVEKCISKSIFTGDLKTSKEVVIYSGNNKIRIF